MSTGRPFWKTFASYSETDTYIYLYKKKPPINHEKTSSPTLQLCRLQQEQVSHS